MHESEIPIFWAAMHVLSLILSFIKLLGLLPTWPWGLILVPFILDAALIFVIFIIVGFLSIWYKVK